MAKEFKDSEMTIARQFFTDNNATLFYALDKNDVALLEALNCAIDGLRMISRSYSACEYPYYVQRGKKRNFLQRVTRYFCRASIRLGGDCDNLELAVAWQNADNGLRKLATLDPLSDAYLMINDLLYDEVISEYLFTFHADDELAMGELASQVAETLANYRGQNLGYMLNWTTVCDYFRQIIAELEESD